MNYFEDMINPEINGDDGFSKENGPEKSGDDLRKEIQKLNNPATPGAQKEAFDKAANVVGAWDSSFVSLSDLSNETKRINAWNEYKNCSRKKIEEAFGDLSNLDVPRDDNNPRSTQGQLAGLALSVAMDPSRITEAMCTKLGLCDFSADKGKPAKRIEKKDSLATVQGLKLILDSALPLDGKNSRMLVIEQPSPSVRSLYSEDIKSPGADLIGKVLVFSEKPGAVQKHPKDKLEYHITPLAMSIYDDAHSLQRRQVFIKQQYAEESKALAGMVGSLEALAEQFPENLNDPKKDESPEQRAERLASKEQFREHAKSEMAKHLHIFKGAVDLHKKSAGSYLARAMEFRDSLKRRNDQVSLWLLKDANEAVKKRIEEIKDKGQHVDRDLASVDQIISTLRGTFKSFRQSLEAAAVGKASTNYASTLILFKTKASKNNILVENQAATFIKNCRIRPPQPDKVRLAPYVQFAEKMNEYYDDFQKAAYNRDLKGVQASMVKMYIVSKYAAANEVVQALNMKLGLAPKEAISEVANLDSSWMMNSRVLHRPDLKEVEKILVQLESVYREKRIFQRVKLPEFDAPFREMGQKIHDIKNQVRAWIKEDLTSEQIEGKYQELREMFKTLNVQKELSKLPK
jgi:hypothetical protein